MKKKLLLLAAAFGFVAANAQNVKFGVKGGLNVDNIIGVNKLLENAKSESLVGFHVGAFAEYKLNDKFAIQPELLVSTQGAKVTIKDEDKSYAKVNLTYINIPVTFKYQVIDNLNLEVGPQFGFAVSATQSLYANNTKLVSFNLLKDVTYKIDDDVVNNKKSVNTFDLGLNLGASYDFTKNIFAGVRYNLGLTKINNNNLKDENDKSVNLKNSVFQVSVGYKF